MTFGFKLKNIRTSMGLSQEEFAKKLNTTKQVISHYENDQRTPKITVAQKYAEILGISLNDLIDNSIDISITSNVLPLPKMSKIPLLGNIACGDPILATENLDGFVNAPEDIPADFALTCRGDSMIGARIMDGDIVLIRQQPDVEDGEIAAVLIENEATLKRVHKKAGCLILNPANPSYQPIIITGEELEEVRILGKAVYFISAVK